MRPVNWHIIDDESINALMAEALREARGSTSAVNPDEPEDELPEPSKEGIPAPSVKPRSRIRIPKPALPSVGTVLLAAGYLLIPALFLVFDTSAWSVFAGVCNTLFGQGSGDVWAMRWIGWSQRYPVGLVGMIAIWSVCGGVVLLGLKGNRPVQRIREMVGTGVKSIGEIRLPRVRTSQAGER